MLLKELYSWVKTSDLTTKKKRNKNFSVGGSVKIKSSAQIYSRSTKRIPKHYKNNSYTIQQIGNDDVLIKELYSWVKTSDLTTNKSKSNNFSVGESVKIKSSAKIYSRSTKKIPTRYKNKSYTIQQVGKNDVLIKELYSWVKKKDVS